MVGKPLELMTGRFVNQPGNASLMFTEILCTLKFAPTLAIHCPVIINEDLTYAREQWQWQIFEGIFVKLRTLIKDMCIGFMSNECNLKSITSNPLARV